MKRARLISVDWARCRPIRWKAGQDRGLGKNRFSLATQSLNLGLNGLEGHGSGTGRTMAKLRRSCPPVGRAKATPVDGGNRRVVASPRRKKKSDPVGLLLRIPGFRLP